MNTKDREFEKEKKTFGHPFEWPDDQQGMVSHVDSNVQSVGGVHFANWGAFCFITWLGTTIAGALFGGG